MSSLSRAMGKALSAGAPMVFKSWEIETRQAEEQRMREWQSGEYQKNRDQAASIHSDNMRMDEQKIALQEKGVDADIRQGDDRLGIEREELGMKKDEQSRAINLLDQQIIAAENENKDAGDVRALRDELRALDPADTSEAQRIKDALRSFGIKFEAEKHSRKVIPVAGKYGEEKLVYADNDSGTVTDVSVVPPAPPDDLPDPAAFRGKIVGSGNDRWKSDGRRWSRAE